METDKEAILKDHVAALAYRVPQAYTDQVLKAMDTYSSSLIKENEELKNSLEGNQEIREGLEILLDACKSANTQLQSNNEAKDKEIERLKGLNAELAVTKESIKNLFDQIEKFEPHFHYIISQWDEYINLKNNP